MPNLGLVAVYPFVDKIFNVQVQILARIAMAAVVIGALPSAVLRSGARVLKARVWTQTTKRANQVLCKVCCILWLFFFRSYLAFNHQGFLYTVVVICILLFFSLSY